MVRPLRCSVHGNACARGSATLLPGLLAFALLAPPAVFAQEQSATASGKTANAASTPAAEWKPALKLSWETGAGKSYVIPFAEIVGFEFLLNQYDRRFMSHEVYGTNWSSFKHNLGSSWVVDQDPFQTNQFLHPYQGSVFHGFARSSGLNFWESMGYAFGGSLLWKEAGETGKPSINDQITTTFAGPMLGEPLFRMASLVLEGGGGRPGLWRELGAAIISPTLGFNRLAFGERFTTVFPSHDPAYFSRLQLGATLNADVHSNVNLNTNASPDEPRVQQTLKRNQAIADFAMAYGLPGKPGYEYTRPFDYFNFEFSAVTSNIIDNVFVRGLLYGTSYEYGNNYRGIWGIYGSYDYAAPQIFRVSSTAASLGTTGELWLSRKVALEGTALGGLGYGAAGTIHGSGERNYHYGLTPQALLSGRLTVGDRAQFDLTGREYYVSGVGSTESRGSENILRGDATFTLRVYDRNAIAIRYTTSHRHAIYPDLPDTHQRVGTIALFYTLLGDTGLGAVDWRKAEEGGPAQPQDQNADHLPL